MASSFTQSKNQSLYNSPRCFSLFPPLISFLITLLLQSLYFSYIGLLASPKNRGPQPLGLQISRRWAEGEWAKLLFCLTSLPTACTTICTITNPHPCPAQGKTVVHETSPWCQKGWGLLSQNIRWLNILFLLRVQFSEDFYMASNHWSNFIS